ncbi:MAG: EAL domain-containing protein [Gammaproteobacteria bacterium]|nr:EAL domain-containing protein [Gammaproteobacteria bacterium]
MGVLFFILIGGGLVAYLIYDFIRNTQYIISLKKSVESHQADIVKLQTALQEKQIESNTLKTRLNHTFEDSVTKLLGWQLFEDRLQQGIKESERYHFTMGMVFVDIDQFKIINDALSYEVGDALLRQVAERLQDSIRQVDSIARFAKDTFAILLAQLNKPETAVVVAQRILQSLKAPFYIMGHELYITVGVGIAIYPTDGQDAPALLRSADHALHLAKESGSNHYQFYQEGLHARSQRELALHTSLNKETICKEFSIYYQPIADVKTSTVFALDALLHWQHARLGLVGPEELYSYSDKQRKLNVITEWLIKAACQQFLKWEHLESKPLYVGVPIFLKQLESTQFIYRISQILQELGFKPERLLLEIKMNEAEIPYSSLIKAFNMLHYMGIKIALDHFGSDTFALSYLKNVSLHYLRLDPKLIEDITTNQKTVALIKSIQLLAQNLSIDLIVQGVETKEQANELKLLGCHLLEGHLISPAVSAYEIEQRMAEAILI